MRSWIAAFALGLALVCLMPGLPPAQSTWLCLLLPLLSLRHAWLGLAAAFSLGLFWGLLFAQQGAAQLLPQALEREDIWVTGTVDSLPQQAGRFVRVMFVIDKRCTAQDLRECDFASLPSLQHRILLNDYQHLDLRPGQHWRLQVRLKRPHGFANPGGFDYEAWLFAQRISATGYIRESENNVLLVPGSRWSFNALRHHFRERLARLFGGDGEGGSLRQGGLIKALTIGDRYDISTDQWDLFSATGTNHLMVISGLHVGLVAVLAYRLALLAMGLYPALLLHQPGPRIGALMAIAAAFSYSGLAGFSLPTQRAFVMVLVLMWGRLLRRVSPASHSFCLALGLVLLLDPMAPQSAGFWLSFGAVAVLMSVGLRAFAQTAAPHWGQRGLAVIKTQLWLFVGMFPLMLVLFQQTSLLAPLVNLFAIPLIGLLVVPLCLAGLILLWFWPALARWLFVAADALLDGFMRALRLMVEHLPGAIVELPALPVWGCALLVAGAVLLLWGRSARVQILGLLACLPLGLARAPAVPPGQFDLYVLDVGQGLAVVVETAGHRLIYDAGPAYSPRFDAGGGILVPFLRAGNRNRVDTVVISHGDNDHAGGLPALLPRFPRARYYSGTPDDLPTRAEARPCRAGQGWQWDGVAFRFLHPGTGNYDRNNASCVLKISSAGQSVLLTGDIERPVESQLLREQAPQLAARVLVAPHHGSKTSSTVAFLRAVNPAYVVFASGYLNQFNHPHPDVVARVDALGARSYNTSATGALRFRVSPEGIDPPQAWRHTRRRYWSGL